MSPMNMCWCFWLITSVILTLVDSERVPLTEQDGVPRRCYTCPTNNPDCSHPGQARCPVDRPYCATMASSPNFTSSLVCAAEQLCSLTYSKQKQTYKFICVCGSHLCSRPFSQELRGELLNYASSRPTQNNSADFTGAFFTSSKYVNVTKQALYDALTLHNSTKIKLLDLNPAEATTAEANSLKLEKKYSVIRHMNEQAPRAEALRQEATVPSDDDEDEGEGSGSYEDSRSLKRPAAAPAAPSSFLPANENTAPRIFLNVLSALPLVLYPIAFQIKYGTNMGG